MLTCSDSFAQVKRLSRFSYPKIHKYKHRWFLPVISRQQRLRKASWQTDWGLSFILETSWALTLSPWATCSRFILLHLPPHPQSWAFQTRKFPHGTFTLKYQEDAGIRDTIPLSCHKRLETLKDTVINRCPFVFTALHLLDKKRHWCCTPVVFPFIIMMLTVYKKLATVTGVSLNETEVFSGLCWALPQHVTLLALCQQPHLISPNSLSLLLPPEPLENTFQSSKINHDSTLN